MPRYVPNKVISDCWSSAGSVTFFHIDGVCYYKNRGIRTFQESEIQLQNLDLHRRALAAWKDLSPDVQSEWNRVAVPVISHRPPYDGTGHITGHNLFVSAYHGYAQLGQEHVPEPQQWKDFPVVWTELSSATVDGDNLLMKMRVVLGDGSSASRYRLRLRLQLTAPGTGRNGGKMRAFIATENCTGIASTVTVPVPDYRRIWKLDLQSYQVHCQYLLIDTQTGYRNTFKRTSFLMNL